ncbi:MAG TPA: MarR family transcriptional regulator [Dehalococcoidia bacterium]|nr:MarR family transcriptional regulator [Dehalococcoidia bacterium]
MQNLSTRQHAVNRRVAPVRTPAGDAFSALVVQVLQLDGLLTAAGDALARPAGQTSARWWVLASVERAPATVAQVARALSLARQSVQRVADLLKQDGLLAYEDNPRHRRAKLLRLTERGQSALLKIQTAQAGWADSIGEAIGEQELHRAGDVLGRIAAAVMRPQSAAGKGTM